MKPLHDDLHRPRLLRLAKTYLADASNSSCGSHTRYNAAMRALEVLCELGIGNEHDEILIDLWEASRYDPTAWPSRYQVGVVLLHVTRLMRPHVVRVPQE